VLYSVSRMWRLHLVVDSTCVWIWCEWRAQRSHGIWFIVGPSRGGDYCLLLIYGFIIFFISKKVLWFESTWFTFIPFANAHPPAHLCIEMRLDTMGQVQSTLSFSSDFQLASLL
jgi:hypothetical protein